MYDQELKMPIVTSKSYLLNILLPHLNLMIPILKVYLKEVFGSSNLIHHLINKQNRILVVQCLLVDRPVVNSHAKSPIFLLHQHN